MKKNTLFAIIMALLLTFTLATTVAFAADDDTDEAPDLVRLTIQNRTDKVIYLTLKGEEANFFLTIEADTVKVFTVPPDDYEHTTYACEKTATGVVDINRQLELIFSPCHINPVNLGEPSIEKIFMGDDDVPNSKWQFQID